MKRFLWTIVLLSATLASSPLLARQWTDRTGKYQVEAELVEVRDEKARLKTDDGKLVAIPLARLSEKDLRYLASLPKYREYFQKHPVPGIERSGDAEASPALVKPDIVELPVDDPSIVGEVRRFENLGWNVKSLVFSPNGRFLAVGKMDNVVMMFDLVESRQLARTERLNELNQVNCLAFTPDGRRLLAGGFSGQIWMWDVAADGTITGSDRLVGHSGAVKTITVSADGEWLLSGGEDKAVRCWSLDDGQQQFVIEGFRGSVKATFMTPSAKQGLASDGATVVLIDMKEGKATQTMKLTQHSAQTVAIAPNGSCVVVQYLYELKGWEIQSGREIPPLNAGEIQWFATFLPNGRYLLSGGRGKVHVWDMAAHSKLQEFQTAGSSYVKSIACSPDNRHFAAMPGSAGQDLQVFRLPAEVAEP